MPTHVVRRTPGQLAPSAPAPPGTARRNRRWLALMLVSPAVFAVILWVAFGTSGPSTPSAVPVSVPAGYQSVRGDYYGYAVPRAWRIDQIQTDATGDVVWGSDAAFVGENLRAVSRPPTLADRPPSPVDSFGAARPEPVSLSAGHRVAVPDATVAFEFTATRPGGWRGVAVDSWLRDSDTEVWLLVHAPPAVTSTVLGSLRGT